MKTERKTDERGDYLIVTVTDGQQFLLDATDEPFLAHEWKIVEFNNSNGSYVVRSTGKGWTFLHRELLGVPKGTFVDHRYGDRLNNRRYNLRPCTNQQNLMSKHEFRRTASGYRGVYQTKGGKWYGLISTGHQNGNKRYLGRFPTAEAAALAWDQVAVELRGEFAQLNFPDRIVVI